MNSLTDARETPAKPRLLTQVCERIRFFTRCFGFRHRDWMACMEWRAR